MTNLTDAPLKAQTLAGQIKQADTDILEAEKRVREAERKLEGEIATLNGHRQRATELRQERDALAEQTRIQIMAAGEPPAPEPREEVIPSSPAEEPNTGVQPCEHLEVQFMDYSGQFHCTTCGQYWDKPKDLPAALKTHYENSPWANNRPLTVV